MKRFIYGLAVSTMSILLSVSISGAAALAQARQVESGSTQPSRPQHFKIIGGAGGPDESEFSCTSEDLGECVRLMYLQSEGYSGKEGETIEFDVSVEIHPIPGKEQSGQAMVQASVYSALLCGVQNCPILVLRRVSANSWEQVIVEHGVSLDVLPLGGAKSPSWYGVSTHIGACQEFLKLYRPVGRGYDNVFNEQMCGDCNGVSAPISVSTPRGVKYVTRLCPNLARGSENDDGVPEFETWLAVPGKHQVFSQISGRCDGWPAPDSFNRVFVIHGGDAGPVASGYGVAWRGARDAFWIVMPPYMFDLDEIDASNDPEIVGLMKADNFKTPPACDRKMCHRVARWIAPGIVAIDWYPALKNPAKSVHSEFLMVPEWLERR